MVARLVLLFVGLMVEGDPARARIVLPPLEQAIDMATILLMVWGLAPFAMDRPRLADGVLLVNLVVVAVMFLFFFQDWQNRVIATGVATAYIGTIQAYVWGVLQMTILGAGLVWLALQRESRRIARRHRPIGTSTAARKSRVLTHGRRQLLRVRIVPGVMPSQSPASRKFTRS